MKYSVVYTSRTGNTKQLAETVAKELDRSNTLAGRFMCQGKMPESVRKRYESMLPEQPEKMRELIENFDRARQHPDDADIHALKEAVHRAFLR